MAITLPLRICVSEQKDSGISLAIQQLRFLTSSAGDVGVIPGQRIKIPHASKCNQKKKCLKKKILAFGWTEMNVKIELAIYRQNGK